MGQGRGASTLARTGFKGEPTGDGQTGKDNWLAETEQMSARRGFESELAERRAAEHSLLLEGGLV